ncbi:MAG: LCP family protein, partial [Bifidobacteriaceae bacterium]|nr:LCP family protein [Bifidobacteriaceae bacterium]
MTDRPPSFTPQNGDNDNRFNQPKSFAPKNDLDKTNRTTTPVTQIQRVSGEVDLSKLQNNSLQKPKVKLSKIKSLPQFLKIIIGLIIVIIIFLIIVLIWANSLLKHENALSSKADTSPAITYLIAGSDKRDNAIKDDTQGGRSDSIMLLTLPKTGTPSLISIPRDSYVEIAGYGMNKLNAAYSFGGPKLMVNTIETNF